MYYSTSSESEDEKERILKEKFIIRRKQIRHNSNPFDLPDSKFKQFFRLTKEAFKYLLDEICDKISIRHCSSSIPIILRLAVTLRILAEGSYQHVTRYLVSSDVLMAHMCEYSRPKKNSNTLTTTEKVSIASIRYWFAIIKCVFEYRWCRIVFFDVVFDIGNRGDLGVLINKNKLEYSCRIWFPNNRLELLGQNSKERSGNDRRPLSLNLKF